jgi:aryl-alcohol dehydrogenase-like predicted oxidoreductase
MQFNSRLALGTAQFGSPYGVANSLGQVPINEVRSILQIANASGVTVIDTAIGYGESEMALGSIGVNTFSVVTKLPALPNGIYPSEVSRWVHEQVKSSLNRLNIPKVSALLLHRPAQLFESYGPQLVAALLEQKERGLIEKLGVTIYAPGELDAIDCVLPFDIIQAPFNLLDRRLLTSGWLYRLKERGIEIHTRSVFLQGLLLMPISELPNAFAPWHSFFKTFHNWCDTQAVAPLDLCLAFVLAYREIDRIIVGVDSLVQLREILSAELLPAAFDFPEIECEDLNLIEPSRWTK